MGEQAAIVIPVLEPDANLFGYICELVREGISKIIVVDDGSGEQFQSRFDEMKKIPECEIVVHDKNLGKGRALKDAITYYLQQGYDKNYQGVITVDGDGQHAVSDVLRISKLMCEESQGTIPETSEETRKKKEHALIMGEREFDQDVPFKSKAGNSITRRIFHLLYGIQLKDTQTGLRGIPNALLEEFSQIDGERYEYEMNMLITCSRQKIAIDSVTIQTIYFEENASSHFNPIKDSYKIYRLLLGNFVKYTFSSLSASIIDIGLFQLFVLLFKGHVLPYILLATILARVCSSMYNFMVNRKLVFQSEESLARSAGKYYLLCGIQMLVSASLVTALYWIFPLGETIEKIVVDTLLFFISYRVQKGLVFRKKTE